SSGSAWGPAMSTRIVVLGLSECQPERRDHQQRKTVCPENGHRLAEKHPQPANHQVPEWMVAFGAHAAFSSSLKWRPVSETKTSSSVACRVVKVANSRPLSCR